MGISSVSVLGTAQSVSGNSGTVKPNEKKFSPLFAFDKMKTRIKSMRLSEAAEYNKTDDSVDLVNQQWRDMANSGDPNTGAKYQELVKDFASKYIKEIDKKFGNGDGKLTFEEYANFEYANISVFDYAHNNKEAQQALKNAFRRLDYNKDKVIDEKELTVLIAAMDYDIEANVNGRITINDYMRTSIQLASNKEVFLDKLLPYIYNSYFNQK
ncbi:MAG: hypothetical protein ACI37Q_04485 [Candidatus Gastranaerophilaceae bacterium]